jgi:Zn-dependent protease with chaperone function
MRRRRFLAAGCAACGLLAAAAARGQDAWKMPARFARPASESDEGGLWAIMDREERRLRRSPFALRDARLRAYVQDIACRLAGEHCPDVRVHLVRTPVFNASMAPNGMMQVWTGLMLRVDNEAQLAAVLGHEIGHFLERHTLERLRDAKARSAFGQFLGLFGLVGALGQAGMLAGMFAFSQDHEREADSIGVALMRSAGYDPNEAWKVWANLALEIRARPGGEAASPLFATHPAPSERQETLIALARGAAGGATNEAAWREHIAPFLHDWLAEEVKRGVHAESLALLTRLMERSPKVAAYAWARGEVHRLRAGEGDLDLALEDYGKAIAAGGEPPETHRGMGLVHRARREAAPAKASFARYLEAAPQAPDFGMIKSYMEELSL